jgi:Undecaprenyl-phosphate glucose phosphotransferase
MTAPLSHLRPEGHDATRRAELNGAASLSSTDETLAGKSRDTSSRHADILAYSQRGKVATTSFPLRQRGLAALLTARSVPLLALVAEFGLISAASFAAGAAYHDYTRGQLPSAEFYFAATLLLAAMMVVPCGLARDYAVARLVRPREQIRSVFLHWNSAYLVFAFVLFLTYATEFYSRGSLIAQYAAGLGAALAMRLAAARLLGFGMRHGLLGGKRVLLLGEAGSVAYIARRLRANGRGLELIGEVRLPAPAEAAHQRDSAEAAWDLREALKAVEELARKSVPDEIIISMPWSEEQRIRMLVDGLAIIPASIHLAPDGAAAWTHLLAPSQVGPIATMRLSRAPLSLRDRVLKRVFDLVVGSTLLAVALPAFAVIALCIKFDSKGPVFFRQRRHGFNQSEFRIYKFRTMTTLDDGAVIRQAQRNDARITRVGAFLRRTNIDELPQLINVLLGQMSLVGPRPHALAHNNEFSEKIRLYAKRHNVKPGITGLSQVNGFRGETDSLDKMLKRVDYDILYIDSWSLLLDIKIMFLTLTSRKSFQNAY